MLPGFDIRRYSGQVLLIWGTGFFNQQSLGFCCIRDTFETSHHESLYFPGYPPSVGVTYFNAINSYLDPLIYEKEQHSSSFAVQPKRD